MGLKYIEIDFEKIWQEYMGEKDGYDRERALNIYCIL